MKAEIFSSDFVLGLSLFLIGLVIFEVFYGSLHAEINDYKIRDDIQAKVNSIADVLVTSTGFPEYWNNDSVKVIGFFSDGLINLTKFEELQKIEYYTAKRIMGVGGYEIYIDIRNKTDDIIDGYSYGIEEDESSSQVFYVKRLCLVDFNGNTTKAILNVGVWI
ncbi:MAG: hypothetical protein GTN36_04025 [Candidatus Aenigmarchaeota archaeon]|nr:hypothetical protein [Candidatus Aenigmarchaeota archaeon]